MNLYEKDAFIEISIDSVKQTMDFITQKLCEISQNAEASEEAVQNDKLSKLATLCGMLIEARACLADAYSLINDRDTLQNLIDIDTFDFSQYTVNQSQYTENADRLFSIIESEVDGDNLVTPHTKYLN